MDHRRVAHFDADDADEEAWSLFHSAKHVGANFQEMRETIGYTEAQRRCLQFLADQGLLASANVEAILKFRDRVLEKFNGLVDAELAVLTCFSPDANEKKEGANFAPALAMSTQPLT